MFTDALHPPGAPPAWDFSRCPELPTRRLRLRALRPEDSEALLAFRGDPEVQRHNTEAVRSLAEAEHYIEARTMDFRARRALTWGCVRAEDARLVGTVSLFHWQHRHRRAELGVEFARDCWGQGLAAEAAEAVLMQAFTALRLHRIEATCRTDNLRSLRLIERLGFHHEGTRREFMLDADGRYVDSAFYARLAPSRD